MKLKSKYLWILDPGHGGVINGVVQTRGKRSPKINEQQLIEGEFNRDIVKRIIELCNKAEIDTYNLVNTDLDIPLRNRVLLANSIAVFHDSNIARKSVLVSIHANAWLRNTKRLEFNSANGWEVFTSKGDTSADIVASEFFREMQKMFPDRRFRSDFADNDPDKEADFYILKKTSMPAILTENFFMTNKEECELLMSDYGREKIAQAHFNAITKIEKIDI